MPENNQDNQKQPANDVKRFRDATLLLEAKCRESDAKLMPLVTKTKKAILEFTNRIIEEEGVPTPQKAHELSELSDILTRLL